MVAKEIACAQCDMCGKEVKADLTCTLVLNKEDNTEEACWCVCPDCAGKFKSDVKEFFDSIIKDKPKK